MTSWEELRDIADKIGVIAREHPAWSQIHQEVYVLIDHIYAKARVQELRGKDGHSERAAP